MSKQQGEKKIFTKNLFNDIKEYLSLKLEITELNFVEKLSVLVGKIVLLGVLGLFALGIVLLLILLIHNILVLWIQASWIVILIEIGVVGAMMLAVWMLREKIILRPVSNMIINVIYGSKNDKSNEYQDENDDE